MKAIILEGEQGLSLLQAVKILLGAFRGPD